MKKILVVEDEADVRDNIGELLINENYQVFKAANGIEGLNLLKEIIPDLIISDIKMPFMNGFDFYTKVQENYFSQNIPFVFLTAYPSPEYMNKAMGLGADDFIAKPYNADQLLERIAVRLKKKEIIDSKFEKLKMDISLYVPHEFRTPLIPIIGFSQLMVDEWDEYGIEEKKGMLASINYSASRLKKRIEKFNHYTRLKLEEYGENKGFPSSFTPFNENYIKELCEENNECRFRMSDFKINIESADLAISPEDLRLMTEELLENAAKFSPMSTPINVRGFYLDSKYVFYVDNEGERISAAFMEDFFQKDRKKLQQNGNGLGLAIIRLISIKYNIKVDIGSNGKTAVKLIF